MGRQLRCPNCGATHELVNPGITMLVCDHCQTVVYWDEETALKTGQQSILPEGDTRLFMFATGALTGRGFQVVGHVRYDHGRGSWDEWYLQLDDGGVAWLSEDERQLSLEQPASADPDLPPPEQLEPGHPVAVEGAAFTVREIGQATCVGGEGQLPFTILPGEQYPYADLASQDGTQFATLEYDEGRRPRCFIGQALGHDELTIDDERPPSTAGAKEGRHIECPNCMAPLEITGEQDVETQVCAYCGAQNDLTGAEARVMGINPSDMDPGFMFEVGQAATLLGERYEVAGRLLYSDQEGYRSSEYLMHNPEAGYLWLVEDSGHFVLNRPTQEAPPYDPFHLAPKQAMTIGPTTFKFYESGTSTLVYVDGAIPWLAKTGDSSQFADLIAPPQIYGVETDGQEVDYFIGRYMPAEEVWAAFEVEEPAPRPFDVHPAQPFERGPVAKILMVAGLLFAVANLGLLVWSLGSGGNQIFEKTLLADQYLKESVSRPFEIGDEPVMAMRIKAPLDNSWVYLGVALMDADKNQVVAETDAEISYYHGYEGGESWSEGSRREKVYFKAPPAGRYRLIVKGSAGSGRSSMARREPIQITLYQGATLSRYYLAAFIITFLFPLYEIVRQVLFEKRRWAPVTEDDDDDDWD